MRPEVDLPAGTLVVADLHLDLEREDAVARFVGWLDGLDVPALVLLGDVFHYWIGRAQARTPGARRVLAALAALTERGATLDVVPGNRDFLLDAEFERASGARLRREGFVGLLPGGGRALLLHGDELATRDHAYQRMRRVLRAAPVLWLARNAPAGWIDRAAQRLRRHSHTVVRRKEEATTDLDSEACRALAATERADVLVCGHVHRFRDEVLPDGPRWLVVDAFGHGRDAFQLDPDGRFVACTSDAVSRGQPPGR